MLFHADADPLFSLHGVEPFDHGAGYGVGSGNKHLLDCLALGLEGHVGGSHVFQVAVGHGAIPIP